MIAGKPRIKTVSPPIINKIDSSATNLYFTKDPEPQDYSSDTDSDIYKNHTYDIPIFSGESGVIMPLPDLTQAQIPIYPTQSNDSLDLHPTIDPPINRDDPLINSDDPVVKSDDPLINDDPVIKSDDPVIKSDDPVVNSDSSVIKSDDPVVNSDSSVIKSDDPVVNSDEPVVNSDSSLIKSDEPVVKANEKKGQ